MTATDISALYDAVLATITGGTKIAEIAAEVHSDGMPQAQEALGHYLSLLSDLRGSLSSIPYPLSFDYSDNDDTQYNLSEIFYYQYEVYQRSVCIQVLFSDLIGLTNEHHEGKATEYTYLSALSPMQQSLSYCVGQLKKLTETAEPLWQSGGVSFDSGKNAEDDDDLPFESAGSLEDNDSFSELRYFIQNIFPYYVSKTEPKDPGRILEYQEYVLRSLQDYSKGGALKEFSFSFIRREAEEMLAVDISSDGDYALQVSEYGSLYTPGVGSDSFTNWSWEIWDDGVEDGYFGLDMDNVAEMIRSGAMLDINSPDEYVQEDNS